jgi:hypothetical protein
MGGETAGTAPPAAGPSGFDLARAAVKGKPDTTDVWMVIGNAAPRTDLPDGAVEYHLTLGELPRLFDPGPVTDPATPKPRRAFTTGNVNVRRLRLVATSTLVAMLPPETPLDVVDAGEADRLEWCLIVGGKYDGLYISKRYLRFQ